MKRRRNILKKTKGYRGSLSTKKRLAKTAIAHAGTHAFAHRRDKKNDFRRLWSVRLNAALREEGTTYSKFIGALKKKNILLDRKVLSELAVLHREAFAKIVKQVA